MLSGIVRSHQWLYVVRNSTESPITPCCTRNRQTWQLQLLLWPKISWNWKISYCNCQLSMTTFYSLANYQWKNVCFFFRNVVFQWPVQYEFTVCFRILHTVQIQIAKHGWCMKHWIWRGLGWTGWSFLITLACGDSVPFVATIPFGLTPLLAVNLGHWPTCLLTTRESCWSAWGQ